MRGTGFRPEIFRFETVDSTNAKIRELAVKGATEGSAVIAATQTAGRGRGKRVWSSPKGGLYCSFLLNAADPKRPTDLSILAGAAVTQTVKECLPKSAEVSVKWPNDCLIGWKKTAGVLSETIGESLTLCVVGIGININIPATELTAFEQNPFGATSFLAEFGGSGQFDIEKVFQVLLKKIYALYEIYQREGFDPIRYIWQMNCNFVGKKVELSESGWRESAQSKPEAKLVGTFLGIDPTGALVISNQKGEHHLSSGEITCFWP